jgi:hypothetical protein
VLGGLSEDQRAAFREAIGQAAEVIVMSTPMADSCAAVVESVLERAENG